MKSSSAIFQRAMEQVTNGLKGVCVAHDDVLVFATSKEELNDRRQALLKRFIERNISINMEKSIPVSEDVVFLGHCFSGQGIKPDPKLVAIGKANEPKCLKEVEKFLGLVNFYGNRIRNFAQKCEPLNKLRKNGVPFVWGKEQNSAFNQLKTELAREPIVQPYSLEKELTLTCDASENAVAAVLSQEGAPVMYLSRTLKPTERNYANIEREALSIIWAVKRAEQLLVGRKFTIETDHRRLEFIFGEHKQLPKATSARIQRWAVMLMRYDYNIQYVPGKDIPNVDALSRLSLGETGESDREFDDLSIDANWISDKYGVS